MSRRTRWLMIAGVLVLLTAAGGWLTWRYGQVAWWSAVSVWPLDESENDAVSACDDPGWLGLLKVLEQDLEVGCRSTWFADTALRHLKPRHRLRARWLAELAADPERAARARFRAGSALLVSGRAPPPELAVLARVGGTSAVDLADAMADGTWPSGWQGPSMQHTIAARGASLDDPGRRLAAVQGLRRAAALPEDEVAVTAELAQSALQALGLDAEILHMLVQRRLSGLPLGEIPPELVREVANHGQACADEALTSAICLRWLADVLERGGDGLNAPPAPDATEVALGVLWRIRDDERPWQADQLQSEVRAEAAWVAEGGEAEARAARLRALVLLGAPRADALATGRAAVERVLVDHTGGPWSRVAVASALGALADVPVRAGRNEDAVWVTVGEQAAWLGPCGTVTPLATPDPGWPAWSTRALVAQAAVEEATMAARRGEPIRAHRLARLAERLDPVGTEGLLAAVAQQVSVPGDPVADAAMVQLRSSLPRPDPAAVLPRQARAEQLRSTWSLRSACAVTP